MLPSNKAIPVPLTAHRCMVLYKLVPLLGPTNCDTKTVLLNIIIVTNPGKKTMPILAVPWKSVESVNGIFSASSK